METHFSDQAIAFLWAVVLGAGLGAVYDWFRIGRILKRKKWWITVFFEDLLFALIAALATAFCFTLTNFGQVRLFLLIGEGLGFTVYFNTVGVLVVKQARFTARVLRAIRRLFGRFLRILAGIFGKIMNFLKKTFIFLKQWFKMKMYPYKKKSAERRTRLERTRRKKKHQGKKSKENEPRR